MSTDTAYVVRRLVDRMVEVPLGETLTYDQIAEAIGEDVRVTGRRFLIHHAQKTISKEVGALFQTVHKQGFKRLHPNEIMKIGQSARRKIRSTSRTASKKLEQGLQVANDLTPEERNSVLKEQSVLGIIEHFSRDKNLPSIPVTEKTPYTPSMVAKDFLSSMNKDNK